MNTSFLVRAHDPITSVLAAEAASAFSGPTVVQIDRRLPELFRNGNARVVQVGGEDLIRDGYRVWERS